MKQIYLLVASFGFVLTMFGISNFGINEVDSTGYLKKKPVNALKKPNPPKKYRPLVLKSDENTPDFVNATNNWLEEAVFVPTITLSKSVAVQGGGNATLGGVLNYSVLLSNTASGIANDASGLTFTDQLVSDLTLVAGSVKASPIAVNDAYNCVGNVGITLPAASGVIINDVNPIAANALTITAFDATSANGGTVTMTTSGASLGAFTYTPAAGFGGTDTFTYTIDNGSGIVNTSRTATVTVTVSSPIWFVDIAAASNGNGTLASPFKDWSNFATANALTGANDPAANQTIFVYAGTYTGAATLKSGQKVLGQGATVSLASFSGVTVPSYTSLALPTTSGTNPNLTSSGTTITISSGSNTLRGFDMGNSTTDIASGASFGTLTTSEMALNGNGRALSLSSGALAATFTSISSTNSTAEGIILSSVSGTLTSSGGTTITNPTSSGIGVTGSSSVSANFGNTNISGSGSAGLVVAGTTNNTASLTFADLDIAPDATKEAINYFAKGSITCTSGTITSSNTPGTIAGVFIEGANSTNKVTLSMVLNSFTHSGSQVGLNLTNTLGSFAINGTGSTAGSGGTIQNITGNGVYLNNANSVTLNYMSITNTSKSCIYATNLSGTCAINNCTVSLGAGALSVPTTPVATSYDRRCVHILNENVAMTLNVNNSTFTGQLTDSPNDNHGIAYETTTAANSSTIGTLNIKNSAFNRFNNYAVYTTSTGSATTDVGIQGSSVNYDGGTTYVGGAFHLYNLRSAKTTFNILNNSSILTKGGLPIEFYTNNFDGSDFTPASGRAMEGKFNNNILTRHSTDGGTAVNILVRGKSNGVVQASGNTITKGNLTIQATENTPEAATETARLDATVTGNTIEELSLNYGIDVLSGNGNSATTWSNVINCVKVSGNTINPIDAGGLGLIRFRTEGVSGGNASRIWREGTNGIGESSSTTYWNGNSNSPVSPGSSPLSTRVRDSGFGVLEFKASGTCLTPNNAAPAALIPEPGKVTLASLETEKISNDNFTSESNLRIDENSTKEEAPLVEKKTNLNTSDNSQKSLAGMESGETVTVNGAGSGFVLPAGKSTTITFSATISNTPSTCAITNTASVSGSNFSTVTSNTTTSNIVIPPPTAVTPSSPTNICTGNSLNVSATCASGSVNWYTVAAPSTLLGNSASGANFSRSPTVSTTYTAKCLVGGCESAGTNTGLITVNALPSITVSASPAICVGAASFTIPYTATSGTPATYSISGTGITTVTNATLPATPITVNISDVGGATGSSYSYTLTIKNANDCVSGNVTGSVTVNPIPTITTEASTAICTGASSFTIPYTATTGSPTTYSISGTGITTITNGALTSSPIAVSLSGPASGSSISYILTVRNAGGCTSSNVNGSVGVNPLPTLTNSASSAICSGASSFTIPYTATSNTPTTYSISGTGITTVTDDALPATPITVNLSSGASGSSISYILTVKNANGCTSSNITGSVTVNATPVAPSISSNSPLCVGNNLSLTAPLVSGATYSWTGPNSFSSALQNPGINNVTTAAGGTYSMTVVVNGCTSSIAQTTVVVNSTPAPTSPVASPSTITVSGNTTTLTATGCSSPSTITWYDAANPSVALPNNTPAITATKTYFAKCTGTNTCVSEASTNVTVTYNPCTPFEASPGNVGINWTGLISTDWNNPCNWNPAWVPDVTNGAVVIGLQTNQPTITGTVPTVNQIYVNANATLTVSSGGTLNSNSNVAPITLQGGNIINDGTINVSGSGSGIGISIGAAASITNRGTITTNNLYGTSLNFGNLTFTNESMGIYNGDFKANNNILTLTNRGTINYAGGTYGLSLGNVGSSVINDGTISITAGSGISNPSGSTIANNACGKILMTTGVYENGGTTTNTGLIQLPNLYNFTNTGTFTNNGVLKANSVSGVTNNKMVITNACPIFTLGGSNNYSVSGIFTDAGATISAGTYTSLGNKFTANNTIPTGTQTLYAQVTDGTCTFMVPFDFNNVKPSSVSISTTSACVGANVTLSATCTSGTVTWYSTATGSTSLGTGASFVYTPSVGTSQSFYASCESTNCVSGRTTTSNSLSVYSIPPAPTITPPTSLIVCSPATLTLGASGCEGGTITWNQASATGTSLVLSTIGTYSVSATCTINGCTSNASTVVTGLEIKSPILPNPSSDSPKCVGGTLTFGSAAEMTNYAWTGPNSFTASTQNPSISNVTLAASGTYTVTVTSANGCTASASVTATVNALATAIATPSTQTVCSGGAITTIAITGTGTSYSWTRDNTTGVTGIAASGSGDISGTLTNTTGSPITVTFSITPNGTCNGTPITATVVVNPIPTATASTPSQSVCSGVNITGITFNPPIATAAAIEFLEAESSSDLAAPKATMKETQGIAFISAIAGTVFNWTRDNVGTVGGNIPASGSGNISGNFTNTTSSPITVTFTVTPAYTNAGTTCTGTPITVTVTVNPNPVATITDTGTLFCGGSSTTLSAPAGSNYTYAWQRSITGIANPNSFTAFGGTGQTQVVTTAGVYRLNLTNQFNCSTTDTTAVKIGDFLFNGSLGAGDAQQTGRMNRFAVVSTCGAPTSYPGNFTTTGSRYYDSYTITNTRNVPVCATIGLTSNCGTSIFSAAYLGSFNPASVATNYLADHGSSFPSTSFYEATIPANGTIVVVVHEVNPGTGCAAYSLIVDVPREAAGITVTPNGSVCAGTPITLTASAANTYSWTPGGATTRTINPSPSTTTTYSVTLGYGNSTCSATATTEVVTNPVVVASSNTPVCVGNTLNLTAATASSYSWTGPNSFTSSDQNPSIANVTTAANGIYTLVAVNGGCSTTSTTSVVINTLPVPSPSSDTPKCVGATLTFNSAAGMTSYAWTGPNSFTSSIQAPSISSVTTAASGTYSLTVANANGCTASVTTAVIINQALPPTITPPGTLIVCSPSTLTLGASGCAGGTITWSQGAATGASLELTAVGTYSISATCTINGCTSNASTLVTGLEIKAKPSAPTITPPSNLIVCSPSTLTLGASGCAGGTITWSQGAATGASLELTAVGTYSISATCTINGCTSDASTVVTGMEIKVKPEITLPPQNVSICQGNNATFTVQANLVGVTYQWEVNTGSGFVPVVASTVYSGQNSSTLRLAFPSVAYNGYLYRCVVTSNGCTATSTAATLSMSGSAEALNIVNINPISGVYSQTAVAYTVALNKIEPNANVTYKSGNAIEFLPGFETRAGAVFQTKIESPCANNSSSTTNFDNLPKEIRK
jgi:hypothetical protein